MIDDLRVAYQTKCARSRRGARSPFVCRARTDRLTREASCVSPIWRGDGIMLWTIAVVLLVLWALGMVSSYTMGGFIHILLVIAIVMILVNLIRGRTV